ncbi:MAG TPA: hydrogenase [Candidatus Binatia bacterium]|jgi:hydroxylaminobenzene mutase
MDHTRRLAFHGMVLFLLGLLMGVVVQSVANPRIGLSAHTGTLLNGVFLVALAAVWRWQRLGAAALRLTYWLAVAGSYVSCGALFLAAVFGTSASTPLHGAGHAGTALQEAIVTAGLSLGGLAVLVAAALIVVGLRGADGPPA